MARLALAVAGAAACFLIGGPAGASIGMSLGAMVGAVVDPGRTFGPRLNDLAVSSSANGLVVPFGYGLYRVPGNIIWSPGLVENTQNQSAKGGMVSTTYNYYASFAAAFGQGPGQIARVWGDSKVIYETGGPAYFPSNYFTAGSAGYWGGICGAFVDTYGNLIKAVWFGHGYTYTVPAGATALQLGINGNYQCLASGGFPVTASVAGGASTTAYVPATAVPWEVVGSQNASYPFGNVGGTAPILVFQNLTAGQSVTVAAVPDDNGTWGYQGRETMNASVGVNALGNSTGVTVQWYGPDGDTGVATGSTETAPPASIYPVPNCYPGTETQDPDPGIQANEGAENTPAFRGLVYAVWDDFPLANFGNRIPTIRAEVSFQENITIAAAPTTGNVVQSAIATNPDSIGASTVVPTLGAAPTVGNTLLFLSSIQVGAGFEIPVGLTAVGAATTPGGGVGLGAYPGLTLQAWTRQVVDGDGAAWSFAFSPGVGLGNLYASPTVIVVELLGAPVITWALGTAATVGYAVTGPSLAGGSNLNAIAYFVTSDSYTRYTAASPWAGMQASNQGAVSFVISGGAVPTGVLDVTATGDTPRADCGYICCVMAPGYGAAVSGGNTGLDAVCQDICLRAGLSLAQIDVTRLAGQQVIGYVIGRLTTAQQALQPLAMAYFFDAAEIDGVLTFVPRGGNSVLTIPECDLGLREDKAEYTEDMGQEQDLPREIQVTYADPALDYQQNKQGKRRSAKVVKTRNQSIIELPLALDTDMAAQIAEKALFLAYLERRPFSFSLWLAVYRLLTPTDVIQFVGRGVTQQVRIVKTSEGAGGALKVDAVSDAPKVYLSEATGGINLGYAGGSQAAVVTATLYLFDIPLLRDSDANPAGTGYYFGMAAAAGFSGGQLMASTDNANFSAEGPQVASAITYGTALTTLGAPASPWVLDSTSTLKIQLVSGSLASVTESQMIQQGANALLVGSEVIQFATATQNLDGSWTVSGLLRGRRGTDNFCASHAASETVVVLGVAGLVRVAEPNSVLNVSRYYRALANGQTLDAVTSSDFTVEGNDLKPWSPVAIGGAVDGGGDWVISWLRRTRFGGAYGTGGETLVDGVGGPVNEQAEQYQIDIMGGSPSVVKRTLTVSTPTAVYTAAMQVADFGGAQSSLCVHVYQISAAVGRGWRGAALLPESTDAPVVLPSGSGAGQFYIN